MKTLKLLAVALVALAGLVGCTTTRPPKGSAGADAVLSPQDEAAVRATLAEVANTWNHHDIKAMCELLTEDVQWILSNGNVWRGKLPVYKGYDARHFILNPKTGKPSMGTLNIEDIKVRSVAPQVAVGVAVLAFTKGVGETDQEYPAWGQRGSFVMANRGGAWKIAHFQQVKLDPSWWAFTAQPQQLKGNARALEPGTKHPAEISKIASVSPNFPVPPVWIVFQNNSSGIRKVYRLDQKGERLLYRELKPGKGYEQASYLINPWVVTDAHETALGLYFPDGQKRFVTLE